MILNYRNLAFNFHIDLIYLIDIDILREPQIELVPGPLNVIVGPCIALYEFKMFYKTASGALKRKKIEKRIIILNNKIKNTVLILNTFCYRKSEKGRVLISHDDVFKHAGLCLLRPWLLNGQTRAHGQGPHIKRAAKTLPKFKKKKKILSIFFFNPVNWWYG